MNLTLSPQIKILALVGLLAAVALAASMLVLGHGSKTAPTKAAATHTRATPHAPAKAQTKPRVSPTPAKSHTSTKRKAKVVAASRAHAKQTSHAKHAKAPGFRGNPVYATLPQPLQWALAHHRVVVVSVYNPKSDVDAISVAEAHAGAVDAGVGFLLVSVLDNKVAGILTALLPGGGLLPDPGVLIYRAPGDIALRLDGFADRASVAQAATNALAGETGPAAQATGAAPVASAVVTAPATVGAP